MAMPLTRFLLREIKLLNILYDSGGYAPSSISKEHAILLPWFERIFRISSIEFVVLLSQHLKCSI